MNEYLTRLWEKTKDIYNRLDTRQKIILAGLFIFTVVAFVWLISWSSRVEYNLLFGGMNPEDANKTIEKLKELKIKYELRDSGQSIYIPADKVYETRINLSSEGIGNDSGVGYEIFDKSTLGMTEFVLKKNFLRAIQGELTRTIEAIDGVESARVHLVIPERAIFKEDQKEPTASIMLKTSGTLRKKQIDGIVNLVSGAVEGLERQAIVITDQQGNLLTEVFQDGIQGTTEYQNRFIQQVENNLWTKTQSMLDDILGVNKSVVRINAELNFDNIETTLEQYDPDSKVTRSEEISTTTQSSGVDSSNATSENIITNNDISKTIQHIKNQVGNIKRLTISVSVDYKISEKEVDGKIIREKVPRTQDELNSIQQLVMNSVGYNAERGDEIIVTTNMFDNVYDEMQEAQLKSEKRRELIDLGVKVAVIIILIVLVFSLIKQFKQVFVVEEPEELESAVRPILAGGTPDTEGFYPEGEEGMPMGEGKISYSFKAMKDIEIEQSESQILQEKISKFVMDNPEIAMQLINTWILEEEN